MIKRASERIPSRVEAFKDGSGHLLIDPIIDDPSELWNKGRIFAVNTLEKDCEIGWHVHEGDGEIYCILSGAGEYSDNGVMAHVEKGDVTFTQPGEGHSLINHGDEPLTLIALVIYQ